MKRNIHFYGILKEKIGEEVVQMDIDNLDQLFGGLDQYSKGFKRYAAKEGLRICIGPEDNLTPINNVEMTTMNLGEIEDVWMVPAVKGDAPAALPLWAAVIYYVAIAYYIYTSYQSSKQNNKEPEEERPSYLYNGGFNSNEEGIPVPIVYGEIRSGSVVISAGLDTTQYEIEII